MRVPRETKEQAGRRPRSASRPAATARGLGLLALIVLLGAAVAPPAARAAEKTTTLPTTDRWTGDLDGMAKRGQIRALVVYSKTLYFIDRGRQRGITYEALQAFERHVNAQLRRKTVKVRVVIIPVRRDQLLPWLLNGRGDIAAANLTVTPARQRQVNFAAPFLTGVSELIVTGPTAPPLRTLDDLSGKEIRVRTSSSYFESLARLNASFRQAGKPEVRVRPADENLEDEDLLEMVNAGLLPMVVVDSHKAEFWDQIFDDIQVRSDLALHTGGEIAWAMRKESPKLQQLVDGFVRTSQEGTLLGNMLLKKYLGSVEYVKNATSEAEMRKFQQMIELFKRYAGQYRFDHLMIAAQAYQESHLDQSRRSKAGAIGVMQVLPKTARDPAVGIPDVTKLDNNIHAGVKYLRFMTDRYFNEPGVDATNRTLFAFASYNAGPAKVTRLRRQAAREGLDPNVWFGNVEHVAAKVIGRETVQYVGNIYKYYVAYRIAEGREVELEKARQAPR
jgi:membrane-bound lytic murein transglycosylase MltF